MSYHCYLTVGSVYYIVYCEAVRSAILATAWLLVYICIHMATVGIKGLK